MKLKTRTNQPVMSEDGQIDLPIGSGTKWYKHVVSGEYAGDSFEIQLASTDNTKITSRALLFSFLDKEALSGAKITIFISGYNGSSGSKYCGVINNIQDQTIAFIVGIDNSGTIETENLPSSLTIEDDTVTEL